MKVYLAAPFGDAERLREYRKQLRVLGHQCTARWLDQETAQADVPEDMRDETLTRYAYEDITDVLRSDLVLVFLRPELMRGGCLVEWGIALGAHIPVAVVGATDVIFAHLPRVKTYATWQAVLADFANTESR